MTALKSERAIEPAVAGPHSMDPDLYEFGATGGVSILASRSDSTGSTFWPRRLRCPESGGTVSDVVLSATGTVWSWTYVHAPWAGLVAPSKGVGYAAGLIDLDDSGPRVIGVLLGEQADWSVGLRVEAVPLSYRQDGETILSMLAFTPVTR